MIKKSVMNNKQKAQLAKVRDEMSKIELGINDLCTTSEGHTHLLPQGIEKILNRKDSSGNYLVEIPDPDQTVDNSIGGCSPPTGQGSEEACDWWKWAQENMRCDNWIKCIPFKREG